MIPVYMNIKVVNNNEKKIKIFFPLIVLWVILFALLIILAPLVLILSVILWRKRLGKNLLLAYPMAFSVINSFSGLVVNVQRSDKRILINIK
jgi:Na+/proline symporter